MTVESQGRSDKEHFHALDLLRFGAALSVLLYHFTASGPYVDPSGLFQLIGPRDLFPQVEPISRFGFLGVHLFFLISGFVILASALGRSAPEFAVSRFSRIYPTYWAGLAFTVVSLSLFLGPDLHIGPREIAVNATLLQSVLGVAHVDQVYWTLWVELQFYGCMFLLVLFGVAQRTTWWLSHWLAITIVYALTGHPSKMSYVINPEYSSLFIAGATFYLAARNGYSAFHVVVLVLSWMVSMRFAFPHAGVYIEEVSLADKLISAGIISFFYLTFLLVSLDRLRIGGSRLTVLLGGLTFPLYVVHHVFGKHAIDYLYPAWPPFAIFLFVTALCFAVAFMVYTLVDRRLAVKLRHALSRLLVRKPPRGAAPASE